MNLGGWEALTGGSLSLPRCSATPGRDKIPEIEITPEMIEAGVDALASRYLDLLDSYGYPEIVRTVFEAMVAKIEKPHRGDDQIA